MRPENINLKTITFLLLLGVPVYAGKNKKATGVGFLSLEAKVSSNYLFRFNPQLDYKPFDCPAVVGLPIYTIGVLKDDNDFRISANGILFFLAFITAWSGDLNGPDLWFNDLNYGAFSLAIHALQAFPNAELYLPILKNTLSISIDQKTEIYPMSKTGIVHYENRGSALFYYKKFGVRVGLSKAWLTASSGNSNPTGFISIGLR